MASVARSVARAMSKAPAWANFIIPGNAAIDCSALRPAEAR